LIWQLKQQSKPDNYQWELIVSEFAGKPFDPKLSKLINDKSKLKIILKDIYDSKVKHIVNRCQQKVDKHLFELIQKIQVFGIYTYRKYYLFIFILYIYNIFNLYIIFFRNKC